MKVSILFEIKDNPSGGGNQFLKALKKEFEQMGIYSSIEDADVVICNSYQFVKEIVYCKKRWPEKLIVHRIDGPMRLYNKPSDRRDYVTNRVNELLADGTIFQSDFSRKENYRMGLKKNKYETLIYNTPDETIFFERRKGNSINGKCRLIATSWSSNINKGFDLYRYLDEHLDFNRYEMTFVGNSPMMYNNIVVKSPMKSEDLAIELGNNDIYVSASKKEPCSNATLEALNCGLPLVLRNDGGNPELIRGAGELFNDEQDVLACIEKVSGNYAYYKQQIKKVTFRQKAEEYAHFCQMLYDDYQLGNYHPKRFSLFGRFALIWTVILWKLSLRIRR